MRRITIIGVLITCMLSISFSQSDDKHVEFINTIYKETLTKKKTYKLLNELCKKYPERLSGSKGLENAIQWSKSVVEGFDFDNVYLQDVMVPHWERGEAESASSDHPRTWLHDLDDESLTQSNNPSNFASRA